MSMDAQFQIRQNVAELQDYVKGLRDWEADVRKADRSLSRGGRGGGGEAGGDRSGRPPVRGRAEMPKEAGMRDTAQEGTPSGEKASPKSKKQKKGDEGPSGRDKAPASHTYDSYRRWDKFDVDAALAEASESSSDDEAERKVSKNIASTSSTRLGQPSTSKTTPQRKAGAKSSTVVPAPVKKRSKPMDAESWRTVGNQHFRMGNFEEALKCYTNSIDCQATSLGYANRAMAKLKLEDHEGAEADCTAAIGIDPLYIKAYQRRAAAREALGRMPEAVCDMEESLRLEPKSGPLRVAFKDGMTRLMAQEKLQPLERRAGVQVEKARTSDPLVARRSERRPKAGVGAEAERVPGHDAEGLELVGKIADTGEKMVGMDGTQRSAARLDVNGAGRTAGDSANGDVSDNVGVDASSGSGHAKSPEMQPHSEEGRANSRSVLEAEYAVCLDRTKEMDQHKDHNPPAAAHTTSSSKKAEEMVNRKSPPPTVISQSAVSTSASTARQKPKLSMAEGPKTAGEFELAWRGFKGNHSLQAAYLCRVDPDSLAALFKTSLTPSMCAAIIGTALGQLGSDGSQGPWLCILEGLTQVPRFGMVAMLIGRKERGELKTAWGAAAGKLEGEAADRLGALAPIYKL